VSPPSIRIGRVAPAVSTLHSAFVDSSTGLRALSADVPSMVYEIRLRRSLRSTADLA
jgi:hypothetical protein